MNTPDLIGDRAQRFAQDFNAAAERDHLAELERKWRRTLQPKLMDDELDALAALDERLDPPLNADAVGFFVGRD